MNWGQLRFEVTKMETQYWRAESLAVKLRI